MLIPPNGRCIFFTLPREIRDLVYEYMPTEENGFVGKIGSDPYVIPKLRIVGPGTLISVKICVSATTRRELGVGAQIQWSNISLHRRQGFQSISEGLLDITAESDWRGHHHLGWGPRWTSLRIYAMVQTPRRCRQPVAVWILSPAPRFPSPCSMRLHRER